MFLRVHSIKSKSYIWVTYKIRFLRVKKISVILFLIILLMQTGGILLFYKAQQAIVQKEMERDIDEIGTSSQKLSLTTKEYAVNKINDHEISISGKLYDIKSVKTLNGKIELVVINDTREEKILEDIKKLAETCNRHNKNLPNHCFNLLTLFYIFTETADTSHELLCLTTAFQNYSDVVISHQPGIQSPPPKLS